MVSAHRCDPAPWLWPRAAYVHIPFCAHQCGYCDFAVAVGKDHHQADYRQALAAELSRLGQPQAVDTLFWGGGTPTYLPPRELELYLQTVLAWLSLNPGHEFSVESNPSSLDDDKIQILADHGVNRLSIGSQSFHPHLLGTLERDHQPADVARAVKRARKKIPVISLDLIFGVPGQTLNQWRDDLERALALEPEGIATYGLTYEKGTRLWKQRRQGQVCPIDEDTELAMYQLAMEMLESAGLEQVEISNFARPGYRCRHNQVYWANHAHFGFGMGAARYVQGVRAVNSRDLTTYLRRAISGQPTEFQSEKLEPRDRALETIGQQLRRREGIIRVEFLEQTGFDLDELAGTVIEEHRQLGLLEDNGSAVFFTRQGRCVADAVLTNFFKEQKQ